MSSLVFFDVDNTLMKGFSGFYATRILIEKKILKKRRLPLALFYKLTSSLYKGDVTKMYELAAGDMAGHSLSEILSIGQECFDRWIRARIYPEAVAKIREHKTKGDFVYLVTSAPYMVIHIIAKFLGVDGHFSVCPVIDKKGILTKEMQKPIYYREGKVIAAEKAVARHRIDWKDCYYYADNEDDLFLFEKVGHPILVNPSRKLRKAGEPRGWPILHFKL